MSYINFDYAKEKDILPLDILTLQIIKQLKREPEREDDLAMILTDSFLSKYSTNGYIGEIKGKKGDSELARYRLTGKGTKLLEELHTPLVTQGDLEMFDFLCKMYLDNEDKERVIGNKKKTKMYCTIFRKRMNLSLHQMYWLCWLFLEEYKFTKKLENIFFDSNKNRYGTFEGNFEDSPIYQYLDENRDKVEKLWQTKDCLD